MRRRTRSEDRLLCERALLAGERLPEAYGPCGPDAERDELTGSTRLIGSTS